MTKTAIKNFNDYARKKNLYLAASFMEAVVIFILSVIPGIEGGINSGSYAHCLAYFTLSFITGLYFRGSSTKNPVVKGALLAGLYGGFIELVQYFLPYRACELEDFLMNMAAALLAMIPNALLIKKRWI